MALARLCVLALTAAAVSSTASADSIVDACVRRCRASDPAVKKVDPSSVFCDTYHGQPPYPTKEFSCIQAYDAGVIGGCKEGCRAINCGDVHIGKDKSFEAVQRGYCKPEFGRQPSPMMWNVCLMGYSQGGSRGCHAGAAILDEEEHKAFSDEEEEPRRVEETPQIVAETPKAAAPVVQQEAPAVQQQAPPAAAAVPEPVPEPVAQPPQRSLRAEASPAATPEVPATPAEAAAVPPAEPVQQEAPPAQPADPVAEATATL